MARLRLARWIGIEEWAGETKRRLHKEIRNRKLSMIVAFLIFIFRTIRRLGNTERHSSSRRIA